MSGEEEGDGAGSPGVRSAPSGVWGRGPRFPTPPTWRTAPAGAQGVHGPRRLLAAARGGSLSLESARGPARRASRSSARARVRAPSA